MFCNCCPKHLWNLLKHTVTNRVLDPEHHVSSSAHPWSLTNKPCNVWLLSPTTSIVQANPIARKTAGGWVAPSSCHVFTVPSTWKKIICRCDRRPPSSKSLGSCAGSFPWSVSTGLWSVVISLSCFSHTKIIFRLPKEAHFPNLWGRCLSDRRRTRWPSKRPGLGMNSHSEKGNQNNNKSARGSKKAVSRLQKLKHKSTATLDSLLPNKEDSGLKRKTGKPKSKTCQTPERSGTRRTCVQSIRCSWGKSSSWRGPRRSGWRSENEGILSLFWAHFWVHPIDHPQTMWMGSTYYVDYLDDFYAYKLDFLVP